MYHFVLAIALLTAPVAPVASVTEEQCLQACDAEHCTSHPWGGQICPYLGEPDYPDWQACRVDCVASGGACQPNCGKHL